MEREALTRDATIPESLPTPTFAVLACGLGLYLGWQTVGISPTLFPQPNPRSAEAFEAASYLQTALFLALLVALARFARRRGSLLSCKPLALAAPVLACASSVLTYAFGYVLDVPAGAAAGMALNASKAALFLLWAECLCRVRFRDTLLCVSLAYAVVFSLCLLVAGLEEVPALITHSTFPLLSGAALLVLRGDPSFASLREARAREGRLLPRLPLRLFVGIGLFGAVILFTNTLSESKSPAADELQTLLAGLAVSLAIALIATRRREQLDFTLLYRMLTPLIFVSVILVLTLESGNQRYEAFAIGVSWAFFRVFTWTLWCSIALRSHAPAACVFAAGQFALSSCSTVAQLACDLALPALHVPLPVLVSGIIALAVGTSAFVMSESDIKRFFERRKSSKRRLAEHEEALALCADRAAREFGLSKREEEVARLVMRDKNNAVIEQELCITESTLRTHLRNIYGKMSVHSRQELIEALRSYADDEM